MIKITNMICDKAISPDIIAATEKEIENDPIALQIDQISKEISEKESRIIDLQAQLFVIKSKRPVVKIKWRDSIKWCLEIDAANKIYFLKSGAGVYKCIAFKHKVDITSEIKNKINISLSSLFKEGTIGRIQYNGVFYYGLTKFFNDDLITLKQQYVSDLHNVCS